MKINVRAHGIWLKVMLKTCLQHHLLIEVSEQLTGRKLKNALRK